MLIPFCTNTITYIFKEGQQQMTHGWYLINSVSLADLEIVFTEVKVLLIPFH